MKAKEKGLMLLGSALDVDMNAVAETNIFTVPLGKTAIITHAVVLADGDMSSTSLGFGRDAGGVDCLATAIYAALDGATKYVALKMEEGAVRGAAADVFKSGVTIAHGGAVTADLYLFGFLI